MQDVRDADGNRPGQDDYDPRTLYIPPKLFDKMTPFERQFWEIKQNHYDTVLFFQKGWACSNSAMSVRVVES